MVLQETEAVATASFGSEFVAAKQATEQIIDLRYTPRVLGVPLDEPSWCFGDNESVIKNSTIPHSMLNKRMHALAYHRVRESVAAGIMHFVYTPGSGNIADVLTKFLSWADMNPKIEPLLFWRGETDLSPASRPVKE